jgi:hypothetical protein
VVMPVVEEKIEIKSEERDEGNLDKNEHHG